MLLINPVLLRWICIPLQSRHILQVLLEGFTDFCVTNEFRTTTNVTTDLNKSTPAPVFSSELTAANTASCLKHHSHLLLLRTHRCLAIFVQFSKRPF